MSTLIHRVIMFVVGGTVTWIFNNIAGQPFDSWWFINSGVEALLLYEIMSRIRVWLQPVTLPIYILLYSLIVIPIDAALFSLEQEGNLTYLEYWLRPQSYFDSITQGFPNNIYLLVNSAVVVIIGYYLLKGPSFALPSSEKKVSTTAIGGYLGYNIEPSGHLITRSLCASAITQGKAFRQRILEHVDRRFSAVVPEPGLDLGLLTQVCKFLENRESKYYLWFVGIGIVSAFALIPVVGIIVFILGAGIVMFYKSYEEQHNLLKLFTRDQFDPSKVREQLRATLSTNIQQGIPADEQNLIVYKGFWPFVGMGIDLGGWSFTVDVSRPKDQITQQMEETQPFQATELCEAIENASHSLNFPKLNTKDLLFISGADIRNDRTILPNIFDRPVQLIDHATYSGDEFRMRRYKRIAIHDWGNEIIFSVFLRCTVRGKNLFVEAKRFLLTPIDHKYREVDYLVKQDWPKLVGLGVRSLVTGPIAALLAWVGLLSQVTNFINSQLGFHERQLKKEVKDNPAYNYGASTSIRESLSSAQYAHYFQRSDHDMYAKVLDQELIEVIIRFLDDHNIDTSQLRDRKTTILNSGIIVQGGNIEAQSIAAGTGAQATTNQPSAPSTTRKETKS